MEGGIFSNGTQDMENFKMASTTKSKAMFRVPLALLLFGVHLTLPADDPEQTLDSGILEMIFFRLNSRCLVRIKFFCSKKRK